MAAARLSGNRTLPAVSGPVRPRRDHRGHLGRVHDRGPPSGGTGPGRARPARRRVRARDHRAAVAAANDRRALANSAFRGQPPAPGHLDRSRWPDDVRDLHPLQGRRGKPLGGDRGTARRGGEGHRVAARADPPGGPDRRCRDHRHREPPDVDGTLDCLGGDRVPAHLVADRQPLAGERCPGHVDLQHRAGPRRAVLQRRQHEPADDDAARPDLRGQHLVVGSPGELLSRRGGRGGPPDRAPAGRPPRLGPLRPGRADHVRRAGFADDQRDRADLPVWALTRRSAWR